MFVATVIVSGLLAAVLLGSAAGKLTNQAAVVDIMTKVHFPLDKLWMLATLEILGAIGLVIGLWVAPLGVAAAIGVLLYFVGAVTFHLRAKDPSFQPPVVLGLLAAVALVLRLVTA